MFFVFSVLIKPRTYNTNYSHFLTTLNQWSLHLLATSHLTFKIQPYRPWQLQEETQNSYQQVDSVNWWAGGKDVIL